MNRIVKVVISNNYIFIQMKNEIKNRVNPTTKS
jgi:hypothetical protein